MADDLIADTRQMLQASQMPKPAIAEGAGVSLRWLYMFANGEIENPTLRTIQGLRAYLTTNAIGGPA
jgi:transcriptional regulator with XRE-family HTH domain